MKNTLVFAFLLSLTPALAQEYPNARIAAIYKQCHREVADDLGFRSTKRMLRVQNTRRGRHIIGAISSCVRQYA